MHPLILVLLLLPNTTLKDWVRDAGPHLRTVMASSLGLMNVRTAERDTITPFASCRSMAAGARMTTFESDPLPYAADGGNLAKSLQAANVECIGNDALAKAFTGNLPWLPPHESPRQFLVFDLGGNVAKADHEIGKWVNRRGVKLIILSPSPSTGEYASFDRLTPIAMRGLTDGNTLTSSSTRTDNLVTNTDIAPTIARAFGAHLQSPTFGAVIRAANPGRPAYHIRDVDKLDADAIYQARAIQILPYVAGFLALSIVLLSVIYLRGRADRPRLAAAVLLLPMGLMVWLPVFHGLPVTASLIALGVVSRLRLTWLCAVATLLILADAIIFHGRITGGSLLGYSPIEGARYYGVGNEVMGLWIGATTLLCCKLGEHPRWKYPALALSITVIVALGLPSAGAKAGGFLVGVITLGVALWARTGKRLKARNAVLAVGLKIALAIGVLFLFGRLFGESHVSRAFRLIGAHGSHPLVSLIARKLAMNLHLVFHSVWMLTLLAAASSTYLALRPLWRHRQFPRAEAISLTAATAASFALNDAGVVAAGLCSIVLWSSTMLLHNHYRLATPAGLLIQPRQFPPEAGIAKPDQISPATA